MPDLIWLTKSSWTGLEILSEGTKVIKITFEALWESGILTVHLAYLGISDSSNMVAFPSPKKGV